MRPRLLPVGFDWHPHTGVLYASNNGPDHPGFEQPPEYFSRLLPDSFHGMPWFQYDGRRLQRDPCIGRAPPRPLSDAQAPVGVGFGPDGALYFSSDGGTQGLFRLSPSTTDTTSAGSPG